MHSSYRTDGNTARVIELFIEKLEATAAEQNLDLEIEKIDLARVEIKICRGCRVCFDKGEEKCPLKDQLLEIKAKMLAADGLVIASPVYVEDVNGIMKNWIDRMAFNSHRPGFFGKSVFLLSTSGMGSSNHTLNTLATAFQTWGMQIVGKQKFRLGALSDTAEIRVKYDTEILKAANQLLKASATSVAKNPSFYSLIAFSVQQYYWWKHSKCRETYDYRYWKEQNWLEKGCTYYIPQQANGVKIFFARVFAKVIGYFWFHDKTTKTD